MLSFRPPSLMNKREQTTTKPGSVRPPRFCALTGPRGSTASDGFHSGLFSEDLRSSRHPTQFPGRDPSGGGLLHSPARDAVGVASLYFAGAQLNFRFGPSESSCTGRAPSAGPSGKTSGHHCTRVAASPSVGRSVAVSPLHLGVSPSPPAGDGPLRECSRGGRGLAVCSPRGNHNEAIRGQDFLGPEIPGSGRKAPCSHPRTAQRGTSFQQASVSTLAFARSEMVFVAQPTGKRPWNSVDDVFGMLR